MTIPNVDVDVVAGTEELTAPVAIGTDKDVTLLEDLCPASFLREDGALMGMLAEEGGGRSPPER